MHSFVGVSARGSTLRMRISVLQQAMEYAGAVEMILLDEVAYVNGQTESSMG